MTAIPQASDDELAARALGPNSEDREALGVLIERHLDALVGFFAAHFHERAIAEDLAQEVCLRVIRSRASFGPPHRFRPWLWTIAHNVARKAHAGRHRTVELPGDEEAPLPEEVLADQSPSPRAWAAAHQRQEKLWHALSQLDDGQRDVVILKGLRGLACQEVAQILGVSEGTVWSRFHRALTRLRDLLSPEESKP